MTCSTIVAWDSTTCEKKNLWKFVTWSSRSQYWKSQWLLLSIYLSETIRILLTWKWFESFVKKQFFKSNLKLEKRKSIGNVRLLSLDWDRRGSVCFSKRVSGLWSNRHNRKPFHHIFLKSDYSAFRMISRRWKTRRKHFVGEKFESNFLIVELKTFLILPS